MDPERPQQLWTTLFVLAVTLAILGTIAWAVVRGHRWFERKAAKALDNAFEGMEVRDAPQSGDVKLSFHSYCGLIFWVTYRHHEVWASPDTSRELLSRLHRFNILWGLPAYSGVLILPLSTINCVIQRWSIDRQEKRNARAASVSNFTPHP